MVLRRECGSWLRIVLKDALFQDPHMKKKLAKLAATTDIFVRPLHTKDHFGLKRKFLEGFYWRYIIILHFDLLAVLCVLILLF